MGILGCANDYKVIAIEEIVNMNEVTGQADFGRPVGDLDGFSDLHWERRLDDTSEAVITIPVNADCCSSGFVNELHVWHHGLVIYRNGEQVWDGPIIRIEVIRGQVVITARDISALLSKRLLPRDLCFSDNPMVCTGGTNGANFGKQTPERIAAQLIADALGIDSHGARPIRYDSNQTDIVDAAYKQFGGPVYDLLQDLATDFVNWTVLGRMFIVSRGGLPVSAFPGTGFARTALLTCEDFINDTFKVTEDGLATLTQDVQFVEAEVVNGVEQSAIGIGQVFPLGSRADAYYGLLQAIQEGNRNLTVGDDVSGGTNNTAKALSKAAVNIVRGAYPPPVIMSNDGLQLHPNAPVAISELVPGTFVPIFADCLCRQVQQEFVLARLDVDWDIEGEKVQPTFISKGADNPGTLETED